MKLFRSKVWAPFDIVCLKWSCILFGMVAGAYLTDFVTRHVWIFFAVAFLLAIKPSISYFRNYG